MNIVRFARFALGLGLGLGVLASTGAVQAQTATTEVRGWAAEPTVLRAGRELTTPVRVLTAGLGQRREVRLEVRRGQGDWVRLRARATGERGYQTTRWTAPERTESVFWVRARVLSAGSGSLPGAVTAARRVRVERAATYAVAGELVERLNEARARGRVCGSAWYPAQPSLRPNADLRVASQRHAEDMARLDYFSHESPNGDHVEQRARRAGYDAPAGENLAAGQESPADVVRGWLESPGHCVNVMWPDYRTIGVGHSPRVGDSTYRTYWAAAFGTR